MKKKSVQSAKLSNIYNNYFNGRNGFVFTLKGNKGEMSFIRDESTLSQIPGKNIPHEFTTGDRYESGNILAYDLAEKGVITNNQAKEFDVYENTESIDELLDKLLG